MWANEDEFSSFPSIIFSITSVDPAQSDPVWSNYPDERVEFYDGCSSCQTTNGLGC
jgi:hypothetical protein